MKSAFRNTMYLYEITKGKYKSEWIEVLDYDIHKNYVIGHMTGTGPIAGYTVKVPKKIIHELGHVSVDVYPSNYIHGKPIIDEVDDAEFVHTEKSLFWDF